MKERDRLLNIIDQGKNIRVFLARSTALVQEAHRRHGTSATASAVLGRAMTAAVMMASDLKGHQDVLTLRINGNGPIGIVVATADSQGGVRGLVSNPRADLPATEAGKLAVGKLVGKDGYLEVMKDLGLKQPFTGRVPLVSGEIAEDLTHYFMLSEQISSLVSLGVLVNPDLTVQSAGGLFVQSLPDANQDILQLIENNILSSGTISSLLNEHEQLEDIVPIIMAGIEHKVVGGKNLDFRCNCSSDRLLGILKGLPQDEKYVNGENDDIEVLCNFCQERYHFSAEEVEGS